MASSKMKAMIYEKYGPPEVFHLADVNKPIPKPNEVLVKVRATSVSAGDIRMRKFDVPAAEWLFARLYLGIFSPRRRILGMHLSGEIEDVGSNVKRFKTGDAVFGSTFASGFGGYAQYKCLPENGVLALKPANMSFEESACLTIPGIGALSCINKAKIKSGQNVMIYGASGAVGTFGVQIAKYLGATVTGVCSSSNLEMVKSIGADEVIDYTKPDSAPASQIFDAIFDAVDKMPSSYRPSLKKKGVYVSIDSQNGESIEDIEFLRDACEAGKIKVVVDRTYSLEEMVEAHQYADTGHKKGNVVIKIAHDDAK